MELCGLEVLTLGTPGHSADSLSFVVGGPEASVVVTGDTLLGVGSTVVEHPEGRLDDHLRALETLSAIGEVAALPGHGPVAASVASRAEEVLAHRLARLDAIRALLAAGATTVDDVLASVYSDVDPRLRNAARLSIAAQFAYLGAPFDPV